MGQLKIHITFADAVTSASAAFATHKYNKTGAFCFQFDDGSHGILVADSLWDSYTYTDGCNNTKSYKGSVGMNHGIGVPGSADYDANVFNGPALLSLIAKGHDIENHSYYHTGNTDIPPTREDLDKDMLSIVLMDETINRYTAYWPTGFIIPQNFTGFDTELDVLGSYLMCISEGATPFWNGQGTSGGTVFQRNIPDDALTLPNLIRLTRFWVKSDTWTIDNMAQYKTAFDTVTAGTNNIMVLFTHSALANTGETNAFTDFFNYLQTQANDNIIFASLREVLEYTQMKKVSVNQSLSGNILTLTIDEDNIAHRQRWRDCSFNITSDATMTGVSVEGFDSFSYNPSTKLVNAFKQRTQWGTLNPGPAPDANQIITVKHGKFIAQ